MEEKTTLKMKENESTKQVIKELEIFLKKITSLTKEEFDSNEIKVEDKVSYVIALLIALTEEKFESIAILNIANKNFVDAIYGDGPLGELEVKAKMLKDYIEQVKEYKR